MSQSVKIKYYGVEGEGRTLTEAKKNAGAEIERIIGGDYTPEIIEFNGFAALVWHEPSGYHHSLIVGEDKKIRPGKNYGTSYGRGATRKEVVLSAMQHVASLDYNADPAQVEAFLNEKNLFSDWLRSYGFQEAYKHAKSIGIDPESCHAYACEHAREFLPNRKQEIAAV